MQRQIKDSQKEGVQNICVYSVMTSLKNEVPYSQFQGPYKAGFGSSRVLDALSCYLSLILKHSDYKKMG